MSNRASSFITTSTVVSEELNDTAYDTVKIVSDNISSVTTVATNITTIVNDVVPVIPDIVTVASNVQIASDKADLAVTSASNASASELAAASSESAAKLSEVATAADAVATAADRVQTGLDVDTTNANVVITNADKVATNADVVQTAADRVQTGLDRAQTGVDASSASSSASTATTQAGIATTKAEEAATSALNAATSAAQISTNATDIFNMLDGSSTLLDSFVEVQSALATKTNNSYSTELANKIDVNKAAIASLATSQGSFWSDGAVEYPIAITTTPTLMTFVLLNQSNDISIFEIDATTETVTFKQNRRYTFMSDVTIQDTTANGATRNIAFNLVDTSDNSVFHTQSAQIAVGNDDIISAPFNTEIEVTNAPLTLRFEVVADGTGYNLNGFNTVLASQGGDLDSSIVLYDNAISGLTATNTKDAIDEIDGRVDTAETKLATIETNAKDDQAASEVPVTASGNLTSTNVQSALEELQGDVDTVNTSLTTLFNRDLGGIAQ